MADSIQAVKPGIVQRLLNSVFGSGRPSKELEALAAATERVEKAAESIERSVKGVDKHGDKLGRAISRMQTPKPRARKKKASS